MCGRFTLTATPEAIQRAFPGLSVPSEMGPRYNIAPTQPVAVIPNTPDYALDFFVWGLVPSWADDPKIGNRMINARGETVAEKPSFRAAFKRRRCLILADGFYEWHKEADGSKTPTYIHLEDNTPFAFAGLWETWYSPHGDELKTCTIITTQPNDFMKPIHNRMPVILPNEFHETWLAPGEAPREALEPLLQPYDSTRMRAYAVSKMVNRPINDSPELIAPA